MNAQVQELTTQERLFELPAFPARGFSMAFTSANNIAISEIEAERLKNVVMSADPDGDEKLLSAQVFFTVKGYSNEYGKVTFKAVVADCTLDF